MTREDEFIGQLEGYLDDHQGITPLPDAVRDAVRAELPRTRQIGRLPGPLGHLTVTTQMPAGARYGLMAAVILAAAVLGGVYFSRPNVGDEPSATASPTPTASETPAATVRRLVDFQAGELEPGTYHMGRTVNATITITSAGWTKLDNRGVARGNVETFQVVVFWPFPVELRTVYSDPCHWSTSLIEPPVGPTVDDLANALASQSMRGDPVPIDVVIDGHRGKLVEMSVPDDIDFADCDLGEFRSWLGRFHQGPGQIDRVYILDVVGVRQVFIVHHMPGVSAADLAEQEAIFESIDFLP